MMLFMLPLAQLWSIAYEKKNLEKKKQLTYLISINQMRYEAESIALYFFEIILISIE